MSAISVTQATFQEEVLNSEKTVLVDFWAPWCTPCRMVAPILDEIAAERPDVKVVKINVDEEMALAGQFQIMSIPTLMVFKGGQLAQQVVGVRPKAQLLQML